MGLTGYEISTKQDATGEVTAVCLDAASERAMQKQRLFATWVAGPAIVVAGGELYKKQPAFGAFIMALGAGCAIWHHVARKAVAAQLGPE